MIYQLRTGTAAEWNAADPVLLNGEPGYDTTNKILKLGDGKLCWSALKTTSKGNTPVDFVVRVDGGDLDEI